MTEAIQRVIDRSWRFEDRMTIRATVRDNDGRVIGTGWALNEVSIENLNRRGVLDVVLEVDERPVSSYGCDGVLISPPAGSTAYNLAAHGPIVPLSANLLPLTPISAFRPRRWRGALLPSSAEVLFEVLEREKPTHVLNAAGCTGRPNVDWCEDHKEETMRSNVIGTMNLTDCCFLKGIHCTVYATGCIYEYDDKHPWDGPGYTETDPANFKGSFYSETKGHVEEVSLQ